MFIALIIALLPPVAPQHLEKTELHGQVREDNYAYLKQKDNPETIAYLKAENEYAESIMEETKPLQEVLCQEMKSHMAEKDDSVPAKRGDYYYYSRFEPGKSYPIFCRKKGSLECPEEVIFDENAYAGGGFFSLSAIALSPSQQLLAYAFDRAGNEINTLKIKDLQTGDELTDVIEKVSGGVVWASESDLLYIVPDAAQRPYRVYLHHVGQEKDSLIFEEKDPKFFVSLKKSKDEQVIFIRSGSSTTSTSYTVDPKQPSRAPSALLPRKTGVEYQAEHHGNEFFILTNQDAPNFKLQRYSEGTLSDWIPERDVVLERMEVFGNWLVLYELSGGLGQIEVIQLASGKSHLLHFDEPVYTVYHGQNYESCSDVVRFHYTSFVTPDSVYDYNMCSGQMKLMKEDCVPGYCKQLYEEKRFFATASDGTQIPISLVYKKGIPLAGILLSGYGAYGMPYPVSFNSERLSLLDRGIGFAVAHIRGGGEWGKRWYDQGKLLKKKTTFTDFIACAQKLIDCGYVTPDHLVIEGRSAGGLLMGAVVNMRPDLFKGVIAGVPFVDAVNTMLDPTIPLTVGEYEEWGNPEEKASFDYILSYSPYDNVEAKNYPAMLITGGLNDARVGFWEPAKWTAKLRAKKTDSNLLLLKTEMGGGHFGCSGRYEPLRDEAFKYAFILKLIKN